MKRINFIKLMKIDDIDENNKFYKLDENYEFGKKEISSIKMSNLLKIVGSEETKKIS